MASVLEFELPLLLGFKATVKFMSKSSLRETLNSGFLVSGFMISPLCCLIDVPESTTDEVRPWYICVEIRVAAYFHRQVVCDCVNSVSNSDFAVKPKSTIDER